MFYTVVRLINELPTKVLSDVSPFEMLYKKSPNYGSLRVFGCLCYPLLTRNNRNKLAFHSTHCTFIGGHSDQHQGYRCMDSHGRIYITRHVKFDESVFPFQQLTQGRQKSVSKIPVISIQIPPVTSLKESSKHFSPEMPPTNIPLSSVLYCEQSCRQVHVREVANPSTHVSLDVCNVQPMVTRSKVGTFKPEVRVYA